MLSHKRFHLLEIFSIHLQANKVNYNASSPTDNNFSSFDYTP